MSERNIQLHRRANEAFNTRDVEDFLAYCDPEIELESSVTGFHRGHDGVRTWHRDLSDAFGEDLRVEPEAYFDLGERTLSFHVLHGRGQHSGAAVVTPAAHLCSWRDGLIVYFKGYRRLNWKRDEVLRDLGL